MQAPAKMNRIEQTNKTQNSPRTVRLGQQQKKTNEDRHRTGLGPFQGPARFHAPHLAGLIEGLEEHRRKPVERNRGALDSEQTKTTKGLGLCNDMWLPHQKQHSQAGYVSSQLQVAVAVALSAAGHQTHGCGTPCRPRNRGRKPRDLASCCDFWASCEGKLRSNENGYGSRGLSPFLSLPWWIRHQKNVPEALVFAMMVHKRSGSSPSSGTLEVSCWLNGAFCFRKVSGRSHPRPARKPAFFWKSLDIIGAHGGSPALSSSERLGNEAMKL